jgi:hypothetical protein
LEATIVLIGDAGQLAKGKHPVVDAVKRQIPFNNKTTVIYLGDNLYEKGFPFPLQSNYYSAKAPLDAQIHIADNSDAHVYLVPGNHDWDKGGRGGYQSILRAQAYIDSIGGDRVKMFPRNACPGPVAVNISNDIVLLMMDSEWWLHEYEKPGTASVCAYKTKEAVLAELTEIVKRNSNKLVLIALHHPLITHGPHGGNFTLRQHLFPLADAFKYFYLPLPVIGSAYTFVRKLFRNRQDLAHPLYQEVIRGIETAVRGHSNVVFLSGHEHTLQHIRENGLNFIVSGSGSKTSTVCRKANTLFASGKNGFGVLQLYKNGQLRLSFYSVKNKSVEQVYTGSVLEFNAVPL